MHHVADHLALCPHLMAVVIAFAVVRIVRVSVWTHSGRIGNSLPPCRDRWWWARLRDAEGNYTDEESRPAR